MSSSVEPAGYWLIDLKIRGAYHLDVSGPLQTLSQWDDFVEQRYTAGKDEKEFRQYGEGTPPVVREFYRLNHTNQTFDFVQQKKREYGALDKREMGVWEALDYLNTLVDDSDPDTDLSQIEHNLQTAEAIRKDGHPRWMQLTGLMHDLGKVLCLYGEPQWAVVGDTFPVGCAWSDRIVYPEFFAENPDAKNPAFQTRLGVYQEGCGLKKVDMSWGHDEYLYLVCRDYLPEPALYMIRYHSCYPIHRENAYGYLMDDTDREMFEWVKKFNPYDLYSKGHERVDVNAVRPYYEELIREYFPEKLRF
ncbi:MAG TPA: inositol oxygenase family protein [Bryobacteraceae bacterium]|nr:inositol oxygenase family protein [Bryobacteraceae bacterium]